MKKFFKKCQHLIEYFLLISLIYFFRTLSFSQATNFCAFIARNIGPYLKVNTLARRNIQHVIKPVGELDIGRTTIEHIIDDMWDNLGRFIAEFAYSNKLSSVALNEMIQTTGFDKLHNLCEQSQPFIVFTGHFANWDLMLSQLACLNYPINVVYRSANNPYIDKLIRNNRQYNNINLIAKGPKGYGDLIKALRHKQPIVMLVDQKMNEGSRINFLGKEAMTADAIVRIYRQFNYKLIPAQIIRQSRSSNFQVIIHDELSLPKFIHQKNSSSDPATNDANTLILTSINTLLANWINQNPGQWFWLHDRWSINKKPHLT